MVYFIRDDILASLDKKGCGFVVTAEESSESYFEDFFLCIQDLISIERIPHL